MTLPFDYNTQLSQALKYLTQRAQRSRGGLLKGRRHLVIASSQSRTGCFASPGERRELAQFLRFRMANKDI